ncbi:crotonobetainyl-CoA:carnitine CoA-transferase CaiB-like acyl-CoA transferase [Mycolicibacterium sp. BK556]|uniref:CaiB/BaiF CoA transferase family protein n=1 Tax=unclassified Mycolicibacterium TaxID=2636767 RepID=UPI00161DF4E5|nr:MULTISPECIES: CoA transferase [unclassified Mycolicibacterium]MBB3602976.1 crotonobetainyl-CoA:carnitine CoA-transferase CaiB-like acyl-CoA transferase [Mycolicibacterium sp. BK556]MBB3633171.1 crotonobetainyl-CoA:carnitine CoA-transferase CaiB-like acyl-CoA transferase [Mycolicibacterium sp. BK607]
MADSPLTGFVVVDLSTGIAGGYCTKLLSDGGAEVIKVETPEGDPLRRWSASGAPIGPGEDGALFSFLAGGKRSVVADPAEDLAMVNDLLACADAVVWSPGSPLADALAPTEVHAAHPHLIVAAITPFGLHGPWSACAATEFTLQAWSGGIVGLGRGAPDRAPVYVGGQVGDYLSGSYASAAILASRMRVLGGGGGELIDLSMLESHVMGLTYYPVTYFEMLGRPWRDSRKLTVPGIARVKDGLVDVGCGTAQQWFDLCAMTGHEDWIDEDAPLTITEQANEKSGELYAWMAERTGDEVRDLATAFRIPNAPVATPDTVESLEHFAAREAFVSHPAGFRQPAPPYRIAGVALRPPSLAPRLGEHTDLYRDTPGSPRSAGIAPDRLPLSGIRVVDLTTFWAGPSCTHLMALLGAEVIHVESARRPDGTRMIAGVPVTEDQWWEKQPIFAALNTTKKDITLDLGTERGRELLHRLIATADVVAENYTPRVLESLGLDYPAVQQIRPDVVMVRMPGFGLDGPWRDNPAFAYVIEAAAGISWLTGYPDRNPYEPYSLGDPNAGLHALNAVLLALEHRRRTGEGVLIEAAMVDAALNIAAEQIVEYSAYGSVLERAGNRGPTASPQNLYQTNDIDEFGRDDSWIAIAVATDEQWRSLRGVLGDPDWAADPDLDTASGRRAREDFVDEFIGAWCRERTGDEIVAALWPAGVPVAKVMQPHRQPELEQLRARGFFEILDHPVNAPARFTTMPFQLSRGRRPVHGSPAPLLGQHNHEVLTALGLSPEEIAALETEGVIGAGYCG